MSKVICCYHSKDLDGYTSGAIVHKKFPGCELIGWDYGLPVPELGKGNKVIIIDICFPMEDMFKIGQDNELIWIDHHVSQKKEFDELPLGKKPKMTYIYQLGKAACEIGWEYFFPDQNIPEGVELLGKYDTWREAGSDHWNYEILPFQFYMRLVCTHPLQFPSELLEENSTEAVFDGILVGRKILKYQEGQDRLNCERSAFEREVYGGLRGLCLNVPAFSSDTMKSVYAGQDVLIGFVCHGNFWRVSLRTLKDDIDVSQIAKARGGGGHKKAAGFEVKTFEDIFK